MKIAASIQRFVRAVLREREELRRLIEVVRHGLRGLVKSQIPRMAAALAYRTLFSLIPMLVVGAVVLGAFLSDDELRSQMDRLIEYVGLDTIQLEEEEGADPGGSGAAQGPSDTDVAAGAGPSGAGDGVDGSMALTLEQAQRLDELITGLVERVSGLPFRAIGFVGVLVLLYGAISMLVELERAFNQIYGVSSGRSWVKRVTTYWTTLTLGVVFLLATFSVGDIVANWVASLGREADGQDGYLSRGLIQFAVNTMINAFVLLVAYSTVPNARVHIRPAMGGALIAAVAWEVGKVAFTQYVQRAVAGLEQLYGVLALLPLFMLWVYITWIVVLFGLQVSYALQTAGSRVESEDVSGGPIDPMVVLRVARLAAERFKGGKTVAADEVATATGLTAGQAGVFLSALASAGLLREVDEGDGPQAYMLARPAESIPLTDVVAVGRGLRAGGLRGGVRAADEAVDEAMAGANLSEMVDGEESAMGRLAAAEDA